MNGYEQAIIYSEMSEKEAMFAQVCGSHVGADHAISKEHLAMAVFGKYTDAEDRALRLIQDNLIDKGVLFCTNQKSGGYYAPETREEALEYVNRVITPRINSLTRKQKNAHRIIDTMFSGDPEETQSAPVALPAPANQMVWDF